MCFVDAATSNLEIDQGDLEPIRYKCLDCGSTSTEGDRAL